MIILPFNGVYPSIHRSAWIAPNATIIGDVEIGPDSSVFYGCVLRADVGALRLGARVNIQAKSGIHEEAHGASDDRVARDLTDEQQTAGSLCISEEDQLFFARSTRI